MKKNNLIIFIMCGMFIIPLQAQNTMEVVYDYDNAGNRILRHVLELRNVQSDSRSDTAECYVDRMPTVSVKAYPNPTQEIVRLEFQGCQSDTKILLKLYDSQGQLLLEQEGVGDGMTLNFEGRASGAYILDLVIGETRTSWKVIKR
ncbi:MAG: T9SS type A sorting domain-containing protein [Bacteroidales bacterium]|nr:T9SS type A sorting domain-containing protein [Bacteroidales bacterium]